MPIVRNRGISGPRHLSLTILAREITKLFEIEAAFSHVLELKVVGAEQSVVVKALQRHPG